MALQISKYASIAEQALSLRNERQDIIAGNIANIDTPFYKAKDINFETMLTQSANALNQKKGHLQLERTHQQHLVPQTDKSQGAAQLFYRPNHGTRNDGNSVDLDVETTEMSKNSMMINAIAAALKKKSQLFKSMIDTSSRVS